MAEKLQDLYHRRETAEKGIFRPDLLLADGIFLLTLSTVFGQIGFEGGVITLVLAKAITSIRQRQIISSSTRKIEKELLSKK